MLKMPSNCACCTIKSKRDGLRAFTSGNLLFLNPTFQVSGLSRKNYRSSASELRSLVKTFGFELERHLFRCLLAKVCKNILFNITSIKV